MNSIAKIWAIMKAVWVFYQANRELIDKHISIIKAEIAERRAEKAMADADAAREEAEKKGAE